MKRFIIILFAFLFSFNLKAQFLINPYRYSTTETLLLDTYPADLAFSLRKIRSAYTGNCIRIRRSNDNAEQDIGFVNNKLDTAAIMSFTGTNSAFVTTWYEQTTGGRNATQSDAVYQPRIVNAGTLETLGGKPCLVFDGSNDFLSFTDISVNANNAVMVVGQRSSNAVGYTPLGSNNASAISRLSHLSNDKLYFDRASNYIESNSSYNDNPHCLMTGYAETGAEYIYRNNTLIAATSFSVTISNVNLNRLFRVNNAGVSPGKGQEIILYNTSQFSNRTAIENNILTYFGL